MKKLLTALALSSTLATAAYAQRPQTDRDFDGLKGPVKSLTVETAELKRQGGRYVEGRRVVTARVTYNAEGNRANDEWYDGDGTPITKNVYRYVGGEKFADGQVIIPTMSIDPVLSKSAPKDVQPAPAPEARPMRRVSEKYRYKYDGEGRISEMSIEQDGRVRNRVTYDYRDGRMELRNYQGGDTLSYRRVDSFDARGNLVASTAFNLDPGGGVEKSSYTAYEFDARGNWVKRLKKESSAGEPEEQQVEYRTITY